jgi:hypothetical protein
MPAGHPVKKRTTKSYQRDVEHLTRLRTAIRLDVTLDMTSADRACEAIDALMKNLATLIRQVDAQERTDHLRTGNGR